jgi:glycogen operon protein
MQAGTPNGDFSIKVPDLEPVTISISSSGPDDPEARTFLLPMGVTRTRTVGRGRIWIRNARGDVYEVPADPSGLESGSSPHEFVAWPTDVDPTRLGATHYRHGINFAIHSANATAIDLCIYSETRETARLRLPERTGDVWHGYLAGIQNEVAYGFRVNGPYVPKEGHRFNPNKLLMDPYAKRFTGAFA